MVIKNIPPGTFCLIILQPNRLLKGKGHLFKNMTNRTTLEQAEIQE